MRNALPLLALLALPLAGCTTTQGVPPAQVTRFHGAEPIARGSVAIVPESGDPGDLEFRTYAAAIAPALTAAGFRVVAPGEQADLLAAVAVSRHDFVAPPKPSPVSIGIGGASFGRHTGVGLGTGFGVGGHGAGAAVATDLRVQLRPAAGGTPVWEGRAETTGYVGSPAADANTAVARLASALFAGFPGESGRTVTVR